MVSVRGDHLSSSRLRLDEVYMVQKEVLIEVGKIRPFSVLVFM